MNTQNPLQPILELPPELNRETINPFLQRLPVLAATKTLTNDWWSPAHLWLGSSVFLCCCLSVYALLPEKTAEHSLELSGFELVEPAITAVAEVSPVTAPTSFETIPSLPEPEVTATTSSPSEENEMVEAENSFPLPEETAIAPTIVERSFNGQVVLTDTLLTIEAAAAPSPPPARRERLERPAVSSSPPSSPQKVVVTTDNQNCRISEDLMYLSLGPLRRRLRMQLRMDGLTRRRQDFVDLWFTEETIYFNGEEMMPDLQLVYREIANEFRFKSGPYRHVKIWPGAIAVGDFCPDGFYGSAKGRFEDNYLIPTERDINGRPD
ncbi:MAG: hypothetical protein AAF433_10090 [Bacteroidota bacterium]